MTCLRGEVRVFTGMDGVKRIVISLLGDSVTGGGLCCSAHLNIMSLALRPICCSPDFVTSFFTVSRKDQEQTINGLQSLVCSCHHAPGCRKEGTEDSGWGFCGWSFLFLAAAFGVTDWLHKWTVTRLQLKIEPWPPVYSNQLTTPPPPHVSEASLLLDVRCVGCHCLQ